jgi:hypothetical protein
MGVDELRRALRAETPPAAAPLDVNDLMRRARRRHRRRGVFAIGGVAVCAMLTVGVFVGLAGGQASTAPPATGQNDGDQAQPHRHTDLVLWATCLREADIPGVRVLGPAAGTDHIQYLDDHDRPLTMNTRHDLEEWGSAIEFCAAKVPSLRPELERQWGNLRTTPSQSLATDGKSTDPWLFNVLRCPAGQSATGWQDVQAAGPKVGPMEAARAWVSARQDPSTFTRPMFVRKTSEDAGMEVASGNGRITAMLQLSHLTDGWTVTRANACR